LPRRGTCGLGKALSAIVLVVMRSEKLLQGFMESYHLSTFHSAARFQPGRAWASLALSRAAGSAPWGAHRFERLHPSFTASASVT
jgi:hypothetical protein